MKQYLLSIYQPDAPPPPEVMARMDQIMADVNALVGEAKAAGRGESVPAGSTS